MKYKEIYNKLLSLKDLDAKELLVFMFGLIYFVKVHLIGIIYLGELIAPLFVLKYLVIIKKDSLRIFILLSYFYMMVLVISNVFNNVISADFIRGESRIFFLLVNTIIFFRYKNSRYFMLGFILSLLFNVFNEGLILVWKYGISIPMVFGALIMAENNKPNDFQKFILCLIFASTNLLFDYRSFSIIFFLLTIKYLVKMKFAFDTGVMILTKVTILIIMSTFVYLIYNANISLENKDFIYAKNIEKRRENSDIAREKGLNQGIRYFLASPIIGNGSVSSKEEVDTKTSVGNKEAVYNFSNSNDRFINKNDKINLVSFIHSHILQAGTEIGIFGIFYFLYLLVKSLGTLKSNFFIYSSNELSVNFFALFLLWAIFMSPFSAQARIFDAYAISMVLMKR